MKALLVTALLLASLGVAAGCGDDDGGGGSGGSGSGGESMTIAVNEYSREIPYFQEILKGIQKEAKKLGWTVDATFANNDPTEQIDQVQNAITKQPDALIVIPIDEHAIIPPIRQAKEAGIPVITMGDNIAEEGRDAQTAFMGVDYEAMGKQKANWIIERLNGRGNVGWIHGIRGLNFTEAQIRGATPTFEAAEGITLVDGPFTGAFSSDKGLSATENLLSRNSNLQAIYFDNDDIALGGIQAIEDRGLDQEEILTVGTDGGPAAIEAVQAGTLDYTISLCGFRQGKDVIDVLEKLLVDGQQPPPEIITRTEVFTPENIDKEIQKVRSGQC